MTEQQLNLYIAILFPLMGIFLVLFRLYEFIARQRTPLNKFKPGTKVWYINIKNTNKENDLYYVNYSKITNSIIINKSGMHFSIKDSDMLIEPEFIFLNINDSIKKLEQVKSQSNG